MNIPSPLLSTPFGLVLLLSACQGSESEATPPLPATSCDNAAGACAYAHTFEPTTLQPGEERSDECFTYKLDKSFEEAKGIKDFGSFASRFHRAGINMRNIALSADGRWIAAATWAACLLLLAMAQRRMLPHAWWWTQAGMLACGVLTIGLMSWSYRLEPNPFALLLRRLAAAATVTLALLCIAMVAADRGAGGLRGDLSFGAVVWYLFLATLVLLLPMFWRAQPLMRELAMLTGTSSVAISLDMLIESVFLVGDFVSLSLSVFFALAVYAGARRWLMRPMRGQHVPGAERMFERL